MTSANVELLVANIALALSSNGIRDFATMILPSNAAANCPGQLVNAAAVIIII
jgi:hypothetical protein